MNDDPTVSSVLLGTKPDGIPSVGPVRSKQFMIEP
jgi:hypothetical protein